MLCDLCGTCARKDAKYRKGRKEENYCLYRDFRYPNLETGLIIPTGITPQRCPYSATGVEGTCFFLPRQNLFLKRCDSWVPEVDRP